MRRVAHAVANSRLLRIGYRPSETMASPFPAVPHRSQLQRHRAHPTLDRIRAVRHLLQIALATWKTFRESEGTRRLAFQIGLISAAFSTVAIAVNHWGVREINANVLPKASPRAHHPGPHSAFRYRKPGAPQRHRSDGLKGTANARPSLSTRASTGNRKRRRSPLPRARRRFPL